MRLREYARRNHIAYETAVRWFHRGMIPNARQTETGVILIDDSESYAPVKNKRVKTIIYSRVSSSEQRKTNLESQAERLRVYAIANGWTVDGIVKEVGSGLNDERPLLAKTLRDPGLLRLVVEHRDRLTRFGFHYLEIMGEQMGFQIVVADKTLDGDRDDLMADFTSIITSFCARLYSRRRAQHKKKAIEDTLTEEGA